MKKIRYFLYLINNLLIIGLFFLSSCNDNIGPGVNYLSFEIDGQFWESNNVDASGSIISGSLISINLRAENQNGDVFTLTIFSNNPSAIEYVFSPTTGIGFSSSGLVVYNSSNCSSLSGGIILNEREVNFFSGTFSGTVCLSTGEQKQIRNGFINQVFF